MTQQLDPPVSSGPTARHPILRAWPIIAGLAAAAFQLATGATSETVAITVAVAALCYLGAAALDRTWMAWVGIPVGSVVVVISKLTDVPWWSGIAVVAVILVIIGLLLKVPRRPLTAQTVALVGFGAAAVGALLIEPRLGLAAAGVALTMHAVWDALHYRRNVVVSRALALFCMFLDVPLGVAAIVLAILW